MLSMDDPALAHLKADRRRMVDVLTALSADGDYGADEQWALMLLVMLDVWCLIWEDGRVAGGLPPSIRTDIFVLFVLLHTLLGDHIAGYVPRPED